MSMVCPQCNSPYGQHLDCPVCGPGPLYGTTSRGPGAGPAPAENGWLNSPWGRILVGLLLAQGLYFGLRQLCTAGLLATAETGQDVWSTLLGLVLQQSLQVVGVLAGGLLCGAGQRRGAFLGAVVGAWSGIILILTENFQAKSLLGGLAAQTGIYLTTVTAYGQPLLLAAFGALGGLVGCLIWKPVPVLTVPGQKPAKAPKVKWTGQGGRALFAGPVAWVRILVGIGVTVCGSIWATSILDFVLRASEGKLAISSQLQARLMTMEICGLAVIFGSALAGATTSNGLKQGLFVGLGATTVLLGIQLGRAGSTLDNLAFTVLSTTFLALAGGWLGGRLFPPVLSRRYRRFSTLGGY